VGAFFVSGAGKRERAVILIEVRNSEGVVGRCDAHCYNAKEPHCECICGGKNHGVGLQRAIENTREQVEQWIESYAERLGLAEYEGFVGNRVWQMTIFELIEELQRDEAEKMKTIDTVYQYKPYWHFDQSRCRLRIYERQGSTVAVLTELADNDGMSVTNAIEWLLPQVAKQYELPSDTIWIEHYEPQQGLPESYDLVSLASGAPTWRRLSGDELQALLPDDVEMVVSLAEVAA
jgi:hypothetical protein